MSLQPLMASRIPMSGRPSDRPAPRARLLHGGTRAHLVVGEVEAGPAGRDLDQGGRDLPRLPPTKRVVGGSDRVTGPVAGRDPSGPDAERGSTGTRTCARSAACTWISPQDMLIVRRES